MRTAVHDAVMHPESRLAHHCASAGLVQSLQKIEDALERDYFMTAEMAKDFGLVDKVIDRRPEMPPLAAVS